MPFHATAIEERLGQCAFILLPLKIRTLAPKAREQALVLDLTTKESCSPGRNKLQCLITFNSNCLDTEIECNLQNWGVISLLGKPNVVQFGCQGQQNLVQFDGQGTNIE